MTVLQDAMFQVPHLPLAVTQVSKESIKAFSHSKRVGGYLLGRTLGVGSFAKVKESLHLATGEKAAVKIIDKQRAKTDSYVRKNLRREGKLLTAIRHPNIVALLEIMETDNSYYLVTELCRGGDLMDYISAKKRLQEKEVLKFIRQIVSAVDYLHNLGIIHRDLKIENLLLDNNKDIKLIDFGLSNFVKVQTGAEGTRATELCSTQCGSPAYAAPELLNHENYGLQVDSWSIGVNMFAMLTGSLPFTVEPFNIKTLYVKMRDRQMNPMPDGLSKECRDLLRKFLTPDPAKRVTIEQALVHPWLTEGNTQPVTRVPCPNKLRAADLNKDVLSHMADNLGFRMGEVIKFVTCNTPSSACATYQLYMKRLERYQSQAKSKTSRTSVSSTKRISVDDIGALAKKDQKTSQARGRNNSNIKNNNSAHANENANTESDKNDDDDDDDDNVDDEEEEEEHNNDTTTTTTKDPPQTMSESAVSSPSPTQPRTTPVGTDDVTQCQDGVVSESALSSVSGASDRKENRNPLKEGKSDKKRNSVMTSQRLNSPRPPHRGAGRPVLKRSLPDAQSTTPTPPHNSRPPARGRLYKRRGELTAAVESNENHTQHAPVPSLALHPIQGVNNADRNAAANEAPRGEGKSGLATYTPSREISARRGSGVSAGAGGQKGGTSVNNGVSQVASHPTAPKPTSRQIQDPGQLYRHDFSPDSKNNTAGHVGKDFEGQGERPMEALLLSSNDRPRRFIPSKNAAMLSRRAAVLKSVEPRAATGQTSGDAASSVGRGDRARGRLQDIHNLGRTHPPTSRNGGQPAVQACRIIPRPFVPFRSAHHERLSGGAISDSLQHPLFRTPQKSRTAESLTLRRNDAVLPTSNNLNLATDTISSRTSGPMSHPGENVSVSQTGAPPRPVIVRKRLAKRHRLNGSGPMQAGLIQDIEGAVTTSPLLLSTPEGVGNGSSNRVQGHTGGKSPRFVNGENLPSVTDTHYVKGT